MSNIGSYDERRNDFDWGQAREELAYDDAPTKNIAYFLAERNCERGLADKVALIWENAAGDATERYTFDEVRLYSNAYARLLRELGIEPGERVCIFMDKIPDLYFSFVGILKAGAIAQPLFSAFREDSLFTRLENAETTAILTMKKLAGRARRIRDKLPALKHVVVVDAGDAEPREGETYFDVYAAAPVKEFDIYPADEETPSVLHYTSGTTGAPKGALHVHGSLIAQYITAKWVLDIRGDDVYWCTADPGWVTGTSYGIIGPWALGATQLVLELGFMPERWYAAIEKYKVTVWYSAPTAIRLLMKEGADVVKRYDLSSLRHLVSVGEPLNPEAVIWSEEVYGLPFHDSFWQTETGCIVISNYPGMRIKPGSMGKPFPAMEAAVLDTKTFEPVKAGTVGLIALRPGWPAMFRQYWKNPEVYKSKFVNGWYICGDRATVDDDGYYWFVGRDDDVINTGGHLVGPFEVESALLEHPAVAESAAVGKPDPVNLEVVKAFIALKPGYEANDRMKLNIINFVRRKLSPIAMPREIEFMASMPKTRSGKIMRRLLKARETGEEIGDTSTLEDD
ncbi:MAG: acetate--CoA ligase [candidate division Zixibacteria bacterium]|nr:acetate--CoA ligase [candidate division Zixibacteria bacterium]